MNCIFCCVFSQRKYIDMFGLFLESIMRYGNINNNVEILVYTSSLFRDEILYKYNYLKLQFEINDDYTDINLACKARLDLFEFKCINKYQKILYLDTDIIVKKDINVLFNLCIEDIIYAMEEGRIDDNDDYWGKTLFAHRCEEYYDKTAFSTGIMLFKNCDKVSNLFSIIKKHIKDNPMFFCTYDQPYIVFNAFTHKMYNNKVLKLYVVNEDFNVNSDKIIHHFPGVPGFYQHKIKKMEIFLNNLNCKKKMINEISI